MEPTRVRDYRALRISGPAREPAALSLLTSVADMGPMSADGMKSEQEAARAARDRLAGARWRFALIGVIGIAAGAGGWLWSGEWRWWGLAIVGLGSLLSVIPVQVVVRQVDKQKSNSRGEISRP